MLGRCGAASTSIGGIESVAAFTIQDNPALALVPAFDRLVQLGDHVFMGPSSLREAPAFPLITSIGDLVLDDTTVKRMTGFGALQSARYISIRGNRELV